MNEQKTPDKMGKSGSPEESSAGWCPSLHTAQPRRSQTAPTVMGSPPVAVSRWWPITLSHSYHFHEGMSHDFFFGLVSTFHLIGKQKCLFWCHTKWPSPFLHLTGDSLVPHPCHVPVRLAQLWWLCRSAECPSVQRVRNASDLYCAQMLAGVIAPHPQALLWMFPAPHTAVSVYQWRKQLHIDTQANISAVN